MKRILLIVVSLIATTAIYAQSPLETGGIQVNGGLGFSTWGVPVYAGADYGLMDDITIGGEVSYRSYKENIGFVDFSHKIIGIAGNGNYHFNTLLDIPSEWDFYAGLTLGFFIINSPSGYAGNSSSGLGLGGQIGGRYFFNDQLGINLEFGGANVFSGGKIGITYKL